jgi:hypothetical protein
MRIFSYNSEIKNVTAQFIDSLNDIIIKRTKGSKTQTLKVRTLYGDRSRLFKFLENPDKTLVCPIICISQNDIVRDAERASGINNVIADLPDIHNMTDAEFVMFSNTFRGNPINITYTVDVLTKYHDDIDQITSNIIAFCNPAYYIVTPHPKIAADQIVSDKKITLKHQVIWNGNITYEMPSDVPKDKDYRFSLSTQFTVKTWIFPGDGQYVDPPVIIKRINFYPEIIGGGGDGVYTLSKFYAVPTGTSWAAFEEDAILGYIKRSEYDSLSLSAMGVTSGDYLLSGYPSASGYWIDVSGMVSGDVIGSSISSVSGDPVYLTTTSGNLLLFASAQILNDFTEAMPVSSLIYKIEAGLPLQ